jgi:hypothetical protein
MHTQNRMEALVEALVQGGAPLSTPDSRGASPLAIAAKVGLSSAVRCLLAAGAAADSSMLECAKRVRKPSGATVVALLAAALGADTAADSTNAGSSGSSSRTSSNAVGATTATTSAGATAAGAATVTTAATATDTSSSTSDTSSSKDSNNTVETATTGASIETKAGDAPRSDSPTSTSLSNINSRSSSAKVIMVTPVEHSGAIDSLATNNDSNSNSYSSSTAHAKQAKHHAKTDPSRSNSSASYGSRSSSAASTYDVDNVKVRHSDAQLHEVDANTTAAGHVSMRSVEHVSKYVTVSDSLSTSLNT